ncbi:MAG: hypothetical protein LBD24_02575 [Spirochaetaceae bacterium]|jgi:hypothetical protein|nr:hypothetical protein [Spirochaetaceae bacterium]
MNKRVTAAVSGCFKRLPAKRGKAGGDSLGSAQGGTPLEPSETVKQPEAGKDGMMV